MYKKILKALLIACALSSAPADAFGQEDFVPLPAGSSVIRPDGDTVLVFKDSWLVSDGAVVGMDRSLREARAASAFYEEQFGLRTEQVSRYSVMTDSLTRALGASEAWRTIATKELERFDTSWVEKVLWGVAGYAVGKAAAPGG
jgi:hypothetical protein